MVFLKKYRKPSQGNDLFYHINFEFHLNSTKILSLRSGSTSNFQYPSQSTKQNGSSPS